MATIQGILKIGKNAGLRSVVIYTLSNFMSKGISFLLLFYFAHTLSETDFGLLNLFNNSILFLMPFVSMGILQSANTEYFKKDKKDFPGFFSTTLVIPIAAALFATVLFFVFSQPLQERYQFPAAFVIMIPLLTLFNFLNEHLINMIRNSNDPLKYLFINIGRLLAEITLAVFLVGAMEWGWMGRVTGMFVSYLMVASYALFYFKEQGFIVNCFHKKYLKDELVYSVPVIVMQAGIFLMGSSAGYFIEYFTHDFSSVGVFGIAATFGSVILVLCTALLQHTYPKVYNLLSMQTPDYNAICRQFTFYAGIMLLGTTMVIIATPLVYQYLLKSGYHAGMAYYIYISVGYFFWSISYFFYAFMLYKKEKRKLLTVSLCSILLSLVSHSLFTKYFGAYGAAVSMCVVYFFILLITLYLVRKDAALILKYSLYKK